MNSRTEETIELLKRLIAARSFSKEEDETAEIITQFFSAKDIPVQHHHNNIWATNKYFDEAKPTILLNSHHDTVLPNDGYTRNPFKPVVDDGKLYGLGSNDAGGALTSLITTFAHFYDQENLAYNVVFAASAEEEISGETGMRSLIHELPEIDFAIVGEPTQMRMAIAEKGLMVLNCTAYGKSGHAARDEGENAIYNALEDIRWFQTYEFDKKSDTLGAIKMAVTIIEGGNQHNVVPDKCTFTIDVRSTDCYSNDEVLSIIDGNTRSTIQPPDVSLNPSFIPLDHPIVEAGADLEIEQYGSPTLSDQSLIPVPSLKMGPGKSARSHTADEFICLHEIEEGVKTYIKLLKEIIH